MTLVLKASGITKIFDGNYANREVDFEARSGEIHAILGENGAGKSTLIQVLCGQYTPDAGTISVDGREVRFHSPADALREGIGVVHQDFRLVERFTVTENVVLGTEEWGNARAARKVARAAESAGFDLDPQALISSLSVGERQRVEILKLLYRGLNILILDEPTAVLDPEKAQELFQALRLLANDNRIVVFITHRLKEVPGVADRVTVLRKGRVVAKDISAAGMTPDTLAELMVGEHVSTERTWREGTLGDPVLELSHVFLGSEGDWKLRDVSLAVHAGEIVGIAGVAGNGQRSLADVSAGVIRPTSGTRSVNGAPVRFIPEDRLAEGLVGTMTIAENLAMRTFRSKSVRGRFGLSYGKMREQAERLIADFGIPVSDASLPVGDLSGGGLQRVILARELAETPRLLVAAQATRGLDIASADAVLRRIVDARDQGTAILFISEDLDELLATADRILVMVKGGIAGEFCGEAATRTTIGLYMGSGQCEDGVAQPGPEA
jgi:general nucleoside transport system ATP-binding protein